MSRRKKMTPLGKRRRRRRRIKILITIGLLLLAGSVIYYTVKSCRIRKIVIKGNETYTPYEVESRIRKDEFVPNSLVMTVHNRLFHMTYLPFIDKITMSMKARKPDVLYVEVKEKPRAGVFEYMNKFFYFNEDGYTMESRNTLFEEVPLVTGVRFKAVRPEDKIRTEGNYIDTIIALVRGIRNYDLKVMEIHFDGADQITLDCGKYDVYLGSDASLDGKLSKISAVIESVSEEHDGGTIDMHLYTEDKEYITFRE